MFKSKQITLFLILFQCLPISQFRRSSASGCTVKFLLMESSITKPPVRKKACELYLKVVVDSYFYADHPYKFTGVRVKKNVIA